MRHVDGVRTDEDTDRASIRTHRHVQGRNVRPAAAAARPDARLGLCSSPSSGV